MTIWNVVTPEWAFSVGVVIYNLEKVAHFWGLKDIGLEKTLPEEVFAKDLSALVMKSEDFLALSEKMDVYCPFEALSVARMEIRHSNFLADIIDPRRPHGFEDSCTRAFFDTLLSAAGEEELLLRLHLSDLSGVEVLREWRNIDLLVRIPEGVLQREVIVAVELKVEASESSHQLKVYREAVSENWPDAQQFFFFLTVREDEASDPSWVDVGFSALVSNFENVAKKEVGDPTARAMLQSYLLMLRRRYLNNPELEELAQKIWATHRNTLTFLMEKMPNEAHSLSSDICSEEMAALINEELATNLCDFRVELESSNARFVRFGVKDWDTLPGMKLGNGWRDTTRLLLLEVEVSDGGVYPRIVIGKGPQEYRQLYYDAIKQAGLLPPSRKALSPEFSRVMSGSVVKGKSMKSLIQNGIEAKDVANIRKKIASEYAKILPAYGKALFSIQQK